MNYIKLLAGFFEKVSDDERLNPSHISMYMSIFQLWNSNRFKKPISISRSMIMRVCKVSSNATYHKCIKELNEFGYLRYVPSYNPYKGSLVFLFDLCTCVEEENREEVVENSELFSASKTTDNLTINQTGEDNENQVIHTKNKTGVYQNWELFYRTKIETGTVQALVPYINIPNNIKEKNIYIKEIEIFKNDIPEKKEKSCAKKEREKSSNKLPPECSVKVSSLFGVIPTLKEVIEYFILKNIAPLEAERFYNYYESNGWLIGGKTKMKNWNAAARNWMLNFTKFNFDKKVPIVSPPLLISKNKNYNEPL